MPDHTIAIVDSDAGMLKTVTALLQSRGFKVRPFASAETFLAEYIQGEAHCLIAGISMPKMDGLALQKELAERKTPMAMIILTDQGDVSLAVRAMKAGAVDFIERPFDDERLMVSVKLCLDQGGHEKRCAEITEAIGPRIASLTPREREVLEHMLDGDITKVIAHDLGISPRTIEIHRCRVMAKMHARCYSDLIRMGMAAGIGADAA